jgi:bacterioferritin-associated ferredoxin
VKTVFIIIEMMADGISLGADGVAVSARAMTHCECTELSFDEIFRRMREGRLSFDETCRRIGCGRLCTACLPDLRARVWQDSLSRVKIGWSENRAFARPTREKL